MAYVPFSQRKKEEQQKQGYVPVSERVQPAPALPALPQTPKPEIKGTFMPGTENTPWYNRPLNPDSFLGKFASWIEPDSTPAKFISELPAAATKTLAGLARGGLSVGKTGYDLVTGNGVAKESETVFEPESDFGKALAETLYGEPRVSIPNISKYGKEFTESFGVDLNNKYANFAVGGVLAGLDFTTGGTSDDALKAIAKSKSPELIKTILREMGVADEAIDVAVPALVQTTKEGEVKEVLDVIKKTAEAELPALPKGAKVSDDISPKPQRVQLDIEKPAVKLSQSEGVVPSDPVPSERLPLRKTEQSPVSREGLPESPESKVLENSSYDKNTAKVSAESSDKLPSFNKVINDLSNMKKDIALATQKSRLDDIKVAAVEKAKVRVAEKFEAQAAKQANIVEEATAITKRNNELAELRTNIQNRAKLENVKRTAKEAVEFEKTKFKELQANQNALTNFIKKNLPVAERGQFLSAVKNTRTFKQLESNLDRVEEVVTSFNAAQDTKRVIGKQKSMVAFIKKVNELPNKLVSEARAKANINNWSKVTSEQLDTFIQELKDRARFRYQRGYRPVTEREAVIVPESEYKKVVETIPQSNIGNSVKNILEDTKDFAVKAKNMTDKFIGSISTRLKHIDPSLKNGLRKFEFDSRQLQIEYRSKAQPFLAKVSKMANQDFAVFDLALKNGDMAKIVEVVDKYGLQEEYFALRELTDQIYTDAKAVGYDLGYRKDFMPRVIKDPEGLLEFLQKGDDWDIIQDAIKAREVELGRILDTGEKATIANSLIRGYQSSQISLSTPKAFKGRQIESLTAELNQFYENSISSLSRYLDTVSDAIAARKFFGKGEGNIEDSIGNYIVNLIGEGKITPKQEKEVRDILTARFNPGRMNEVLGAIKQGGYISVMGSLTNSVTQLGDLGFSIYKAGFYETAKSVFKQLTGKQAISIKELGIDKIAAEFDDTSRLGKITDAVFKATGLNRLDRLGKETFIDATYNSFKGKAKNPSPKFVAELDRVFGAETDQVLKDLRDGNITDNVKYLMFNELLDISPVALSEMPEVYLKSGNGKIFYTLKSYSLKVLDVYRNQVIDLLKTDPKQAVKNFVWLTACIVGANATADELKDFITGRQTSLKDTTINNLLKIILVNRYTLDNIQKKGIGSTIVGDVIAPPTKIYDSISKGDMDGLLRSVPVAGEIAYWWLGGGVDKRAKDEKKQKKTEGTMPTLPELPKLPKLPSLPAIP